MSISFSGLNSGLDTTSWITSLTALKQAKVTTLQKQQETIQTSLQALNGIKSYFSTFRSMITKVTDAKFNVASLDIFSRHIATSSNLNILTATASADALEGTYNIKVDQLATKTEATSQVKTKTTTTVTNTTTEDTLLKNLGIRAGGIDVSPDESGISVRINITENETVGSLINKLKNIGVKASFNEQSAVFNVDVGVNSITDVGRTGVISGLKLQGVNKGYETEDLSYKEVESVTNLANGTTKLEDLGVRAGNITIQTNESTYSLTLEENDTLQDLIDALQSEGIESSIQGGYFKIDNAYITNDGTTHLLDALGIAHPEVAGNTQISTALNYSTVFDTVTMANGSTQLQDLGVENGSIVIKKDNTNYTIAVDKTKSLQEFIESLGEKGISASIQDGIFTIDNAEIINDGATGMINALGLANPDVDSVQQKSGVLTYTTVVSTTSVANGDTNLGTYGVSDGELVVKSNGSTFTISVTSSMTLNDLVQAFNDNHLEASYIDGVLDIGDVEIDATSTTTNIVSKLGIGTDGVSYLLQESNALKYMVEVTHLAAATETTALSEFNVNAGTITVQSYDNDGNIQTSNITIGADMTFQQLINAFRSLNSMATIDGGILVLPNANIIDEGTTNIKSALGISDTIYASNIQKSGALKYTTIETHTTTASATTRLSYLGISSGNLVLSDKNNTYTVSIDTTETLGDFISRVNGIEGFTATLNNGDITLSGMEIISDGGTNLISALNLSQSNAVATGHYQSSNPLKYTTIEVHTTTVDATTTLKQICNGAGTLNNGTITVNDGDKSVNIVISRDDTLEELFNKFRTALDGETVSMTNGVITFENVNITDEGGTNIKTFMGISETATGFHAWSDRLTYYSVTTETTTINADTVFGPTAAASILNSATLHDGTIKIANTHETFNIAFTTAESVGTLISDILDLNRLYGTNFSASLNNGVLSIGGANIVDYGTTGLNSVLDLQNKSVSDIYNWGNVTQYYSVTSETTTVNHSTTFNSIHGGTTLVDGSILIADRYTTHTVEFHPLEAIQVFLDRINLINGMSATLVNGDLTINGGNIVDYGGTGFDTVLGVNTTAVTGTYAYSNLITYNSETMETTTVLHSTTFAPSESASILNSATLQNGNILIADKYNTHTIAFTTDMTYENLITAINNTGTMSASLSNGVFRINGGNVISYGNTHLDSVLNMQNESVAGIYSYGIAVQYNSETTETTTVKHETTFDTMHGAEGISNGTLQVANKYTTQNIAFTKTERFQDLLDDLNSIDGVTASLNNGIISINGAYIASYGGTGLDTVLGIEQLTPAAGIYAYGTTQSFTSVTYSTTNVTDTTNLNSILSSGTISNGTITVATTHNTFNISITDAANETFGSLIQKFADVGISANLNNGIFRVNDANITSFGTTNLQSVLGIAKGQLSGIYAFSDALQYTESITNTTTVTSASTITSLGTGDVVLADQNGNYTTINITANDNTYGSILAKLSAAGITASLNGGVFSIQNVNITTDNANFVNALGLSSSGDGVWHIWSETIQYSSTTMTTTQVDYSTTIGVWATGAGASVTNGKMVIENLSGDLYTITVHTTDTFGSIVTKIAAFARTDTSVSMNDGVLSISGINIVSDTSNLMSAINCHQVSVNSTRQMSDVLTANTTTYGISDASGTDSIISWATANNKTFSNGNLVFTNSDNQLITVNVTTSMTFNNLVSAINNAAGNSGNASYVDGIFVANGINFVSDSSGLWSAMGMTQYASSSMQASNALYYTYYVNQTVNADLTTKLSDLNVTPAARYVFKGDNGVYASVTFASTDTLSDVVSKINAASSTSLTLSASFTDGILTVAGATGIYTDNGVTPASFLGLQAHTGRTYTGRKVNYAGGATSTAVVSSTQYLTTIIGTTYDYIDDQSYQVSVQDRVDTWEMRSTFQGSSTNHTGTNIGGQHIYSTVYTSGTYSAWDGAELYHTYITVRNSETNNSQVIDYINYYLGYEPYSYGGANRYTYIEDMTSEIWVQVSVTETTYNVDQHTSTYNLQTVTNLLNAINTNTVGVSASLDSDGHLYIENGNISGKIGDAFGMTTGASDPDIATWQDNIELRRYLAGAGYDSSTSGILKIKQNGTVVTVGTLTSSTTYGQFKSMLSPYGVTFSTNGSGVLTAHTPDGIEFLTAAEHTSNGGSSSDLGYMFAQFINYGGVVSQSTMIGSQQQHEASVAASALISGTTELGSMGVSAGNYKLVIDGTEYDLTAGASTTVNDFISAIQTKAGALWNNGVSARVENGSIIIEGTNGHGVYISGLDISMDTTTLGDFGLNNVTMSVLNMPSNCGLSVDQSATYDGFLVNPYTYTDAQVAEMTSIQNVNSFTNGQSYKIETAADLERLATLVNSGNNGSGAIFVLANDLDLSTVTNWTAIGATSNYFNGTFDGNGHTISNLNLTSNSDNQGLFGATNYATIKNVNIENAYVSTNANSTGILLGLANYGTISNCRTSGNVIGNTRVGGVVGNNYNDVMVMNCSSDATVYGSNMAGGIMGDMLGTVTNCYASGTVTSGDYAGGIVGEEYGGTISNCASEAVVIATNGRAGGITGGQLTGHGDCLVNNCYSDSTVTGSFAGGIAGEALQNISNCVNVGNASTNSNSRASYNVSNLVGWYSGMYSGSNPTDMPAYYSGSPGDDGVYYMKVTFSGYSDFTCYINSYAESNYDYTYVTNLDANNYYESEYVTTSGFQNLPTTFGTSNWKTVTFSNLDGGEHSFWVAYKKDGSVNSGWDCGHILIGGGNEYYAAGAIAGSQASGTVSSCYTTEGDFIGNANGTSSGNSTLTPTTTTFNSNTTLTQVQQWLSNNSITMTQNGSVFEFSQSGSQTKVLGGTLSNAFGISGMVKSTPVSFDAFGGEGYSLSTKLNAIGITGNKSLTAVQLNGNMGLTLDQSATYDGFLANPYTYTDQQVAAMTSIQNVSSFTSGQSYKIETAADLQRLATLVNGRQNGSGATFVLANDIDLSSIANWTAIGNTSYYFQGTFDGNGHTISNLKINGSANYQGLFGGTIGATIKNVNIENASVNGGTGSCTGILAGYATSTTVLNCRTSGTVTSSSSNVGGLVGYLSDYCNIYDCISEATVSGSMYVGGLVGYSNNNRTITNCATYGNVTATSTYAGGIAGNNQRSPITNCISYGNIIGTGNYAGGIAGYSHYGIVQDCVSLGSVTGAYSGAMAGYLYYGSITNSGTSTTMNIYGDKTGGTLTGNVTLTSTSTTFSDSSDLESIQSWFDSNGMSMSLNGSELSFSTTGANRYVLSGTFADALNLNGVLNSTGKTYELPAVAVYNGSNSNIANVLFDNNYDIAYSYGSDGLTVEQEVHNSVLVSVFVNSTSALSDLGITDGNVRLVVNNTNYTISVTSSQTLSDFVAQIGNTINDDSIWSYSLPTAANGFRFAIEGINGNQVYLESISEATLQTVTITSTSVTTGATTVIASQSTKISELEGGSALIGQTYGILDSNGNLIAGGGEISYGTITLGDLGITGDQVITVAGGIQSGVQAGGGVTLDQSATYDGFMVNPYTYTDQQVAAMTSIQDVSSFTSGQSYKIATVADLQKLATLVNSGNSGNGATFVLAGDIDLTSVANWTAIGTVDGSKSFQGTFDGNGHTISNLKINNSSSYQGLFGYVYNATVKDVKLEDFDLTTGVYSGALIAEAEDSNITNCIASGCLAAASTDKSEMGGLVGFLNGGTIQSSKTYGVINAGSFNYNFGGIAGTLDRGAVIDNSINYMNVTAHTDAGGIAGGLYNGTCKITNCVNYGNITSTSTTSDSYGAGSAGGIVGYAMGQEYIANCLNYGDITSVLGYAGVIIGDEYYGTNTLVSCATSGTMSLIGKVGSGGTSTSTGNYTISAMGMTRDLSDIYNGFVANPYSYSDAQVAAMTSISNVDSITSGQCYKIETVADLQQFVCMVNRGENGYGSTFVLANDIDLSSVANWTTIGNTNHYFAGTFDGNGHTISNLKVNNNAECQGLFGYVDGGTVKNVNIENASVTGTNCVGILVGEANHNSTVYNCRTSGTVTGTGTYVGGLVGSLGNSSNVRDCVSEATVFGSKYVGGLVGLSENNTITNCATYGSVTATYNYAGGIVGWNQRSLITNCVSYGNAGAGDYAGGIAADSYSGIVQDCASLGSVTGTYSAAIVSHFNGGTISRCGTSTTMDIYGAYSMYGNGTLSNNVTLTTATTTFNANTTLDEIQSWLGSHTVSMTATNGMISAVSSNSGYQEIIYGSLAEALGINQQVSSTMFASAPVNMPNITATTSYTIDENTTIDDILANCPTGTATLNNGVITLNNIHFTQNLDTLFGLSINSGSAAATASTKISELEGGLALVDQTYSVYDINGNEIAPNHDFISEITTVQAQITVTDAASLANAISNYTTIGIANAEVLAQFATLVNSGNYYDGKTFVLTDDIDLSGYAEWTQIGNSAGNAKTGTYWTNAFYGNFNGNGHVIKNLKTTGQTSANAAYSGLFGLVIGNISNVGLENADVNCSTVRYVGGLAGHVVGNIDNCYVTGTVKSSYTATSAALGGIAAKQESGTIKDSYTDGNVLCTNNNINARMGGIVGIGANINHCFTNVYLMGWNVNIIGGLYATVSGSVTSSAYTGTIKVNNSEVTTICVGNAFYNTESVTANIPPYNSVFSISSDTTIADILANCPTGTAAFNDGYVVLDGVHFSNNLDSLLGLSSIQPQVQNYAMSGSGLRRLNTTYSYTYTTNTVTYTDTYTETVYEEPSANMQLSSLKTSTDWGDTLCDINDGYIRVHNDVTNETANINISTSMTIAEVVSALNEVISDSTDTWVQYGRPNYHYNYAMLLVTNGTGNDMQARVRSDTTGLFGYGSYYGRPIVDPNGDNYTYTVTYTATATTTTTTTNVSTNTIALDSTNIQLQDIINSSNQGWTQAVGGGNTGTITVFGNSITVNKTDTVQSVINSLAGYGITATFSGGSLSLSNTSDTACTIGGNVASLLGIAGTLSASGDPYSVNCATIITTRTINGNATCTTVTLTSTYTSDALVGQENTYTSDGLSMITTGLHTVTTTSTHTEIVCAEGDSNIAYKLFNNTHNSAYNYESDGMNGVESDGGNTYSVDWATKLGDIGVTAGTLGIVNGSGTTYITITTDNTVSDLNNALKAKGVTLKIESTSDGAVISYQSSNNHLVAGTSNIMNVIFSNGGYTEGLISDVKTYTYTTNEIKSADWNTKIYGDSENTSLGLGMNTSAESYVKNASGIAVLTITTTFTTTLGDIRNALASKNITMKMETTSGGVHFSYETTDGMYIDGDLLNLFTHRNEVYDYSTGTLQTELNDGGQTYDLGANPLLSTLGITEGTVLIEGLNGSQYYTYTVTSTSTINDFVNKCRENFVTINLSQTDSGTRLSYESNSRRITAGTSDLVSKLFGTEHLTYNYRADHAHQITYSDGGLNHNADDNTLLKDLNITNGTMVIRSLNGSAHATYTVDATSTLGNYIQWARENGITINIAQTSSGTIFSYDSNSLRIDNGTSNANSVLFGNDRLTYNIKSDSTMIHYTDGGLTHSADNDTLLNHLGINNGTVEIQGLNGGSVTTFTVSETSTVSDLITWAKIYGGITINFAQTDSGTIFSYNSDSRKIVDVTSNAAAKLFNHASFVYQYRAEDLMTTTSDNGQYHNIDGNTLIKHIGTTSTNPVGISMGTVEIQGLNGGTYATYTITETTRLNDLITWAASKSLTIEMTQTNDGTIFSFESQNRKLVDGTSNFVATLLNNSVETHNIESKELDITYSDLGQTHDADWNTRLKDLGVTNGNITIKNLATGATIAALTINKENTIEQLKQQLLAQGITINMNVTDAGVVTLEYNTNAVEIQNGTSNLATQLFNNNFTTNRIATQRLDKLFAEEMTYNAAMNTAIGHTEQNTGISADLGGFVTSSDGLGCTGGKYVVHDENGDHTLSISTTNTIADINAQIAAYGITITTTTTAEGTRFIINTNTDAYLRSATGSGASDFVDKLFGGRTSIYEYNTHKDILFEEPVEYNVTGNNLLTELGTHIILNPDGTTTTSTYGITSTHVTEGIYDIVNADGTRVTKTITSETTINDFINELRTAGFTAELITENGNAYIRAKGSGNQYIDTSTAEGNKSNVVSALFSNEKKTTYNYAADLDMSTTSNETFDIDNDTELSTVGITTGRFNVVVNGRTIATDITEGMTFGNLDDLLSGYGINMSLVRKEDGIHLVLDSTNNAKVEAATGAGASNLVTKIGLVTKTTQYDYSSNELTITDITTNTVSATGSMLLKDYGITSGQYYIIKDGERHALNISIDETFDSFIDTLRAYGIIGRLVENNGSVNFEITSTGNTYIENATGTGASNVGSMLAGNSITVYDYQSTLTISNTNTEFVEATNNALLSEYGITSGEFYIYSNGVRIIANISKDETFGTLTDTLSKFGIRGSLVKTNGEVHYVINGDGDSYIAKSNSSTASNIMDVLFTNGKLTMYNYGNTLSTESTVTHTVTASESTLLSAFDTNSLKAAGKISLTVDGKPASIEISADETFGSLINKFAKLGINATISPTGKFIINSGYSNVAINAAGTTSNLQSTIGLTLNNDLGGYASSYEALTYNETIVSDNTLSVANYADYNTQMSLLNISNGILSLYRDGQKATVQINNNETFGQLRSRIQSAFSQGDVDIKFTNGMLEIYSTTDGVKVEAGTTTDSSNFYAICGLNAINNKVTSSRELYKVNGTSKLTTVDLFRAGNVTEGTFVVGGETFTIDSNTTLNDIIARINSSDTANATAYWDSVDGKLVLKSRTAGYSLINVEAGTSNFTDVMGFTATDRNVDGTVRTTKLNSDAQVFGENAVFEINGTKFTSASNHIGSDVSRLTGITLDLKGVSAGEEVTLTIERDKETVANTVSDVVDAYNELIENVDVELSKSGNLSNQSALKMIRNQLRNLMTSSIATNGVFKNLSQIGISISSAAAGNISTSNINTLTFDADKFMEQFVADPTAVKQLLVGTEDFNGIFISIDNILESALSSVSGYFDSAANSYNSQLQNLSQKISNANAAVERYRERLETKFGAMDMLIGKMQQQYSSFLGT